MAVGLCCNTTIVLGQGLQLAGKCIAIGKKIILQHGCAVAENCIAIGRFVGWAIVLQYTKVYCG